MFSVSLYSHGLWLDNSQLFLTCKLLIWEDPYTATINEDNDIPLPKIVLLHGDHIGLQEYVSFDEDVSLCEPLSAYHLLNEFKLAGNPAMEDEPADDDNNAPVVKPPPTMTFS